MTAPPPMTINTPIVQTCSQPNKDVTVITAATPPPTLYQGEITKAETVYVRVTVDVDGSVQHVAIYKSAGNEKLDQAAMLAARKSSFSPKIVDCNPIPADFMFRVILTPPSPSPSPSSTP